MKKQQHRTEKTINELKSSIDSIERMIEKSQQLLKNTKPRNPREVRSDSIELKFHSRSQSKDKSLQKSDPRQFTRPSTHYVGSRNVLEKCISKESSIHAPQQTKPNYRGKLKFDIESISGESRKQHSKILINDESLPISPIHNEERREKSTQKYFLDSSLGTLQQNRFTEGGEHRRLRTDTFSTFNDSWESSGFYNSVQRKQKKDKYATPRKIVLKKRLNRKISNHEQFEQQRQKSQKNRIFRNSGMEGRYSYYKQVPSSNHWQNLNQTTTENEPHYRQTGSFRLATLSSAREPCQKHQKENQQMNLSQFLKKVKKYGFVERYLSQSQISCIYEYLKKSSIPEYKWPLYVVDEVYDKMKHNGRNKS